MAASRARHRGQRQSSTTTPPHHHNATRQVSTRGRGERERAAHVEHLLCQRSVPVAPHARHLDQAVLSRRALAADRLRGLRGRRRRRAALRCAARICRNVHLCRHVHP
eukprot:2480823-Rhodomonas_salina.1